MIVDFGYGRYVFNLLLRAAAAGLQLIAFIATSKHLTISEVGIFGLFMTFVGIGVLFANFNFHVAFTRSINQKKTTPSQALADSAGFVVLAWPITFTIIGVLLNKYSTVSIFYSQYFVFLFFLSFNNVAENFLVAIGKGNFASSIVFIRSMWVIIWLFLIAFGELKADLDMIFRTMICVEVMIFFMNLILVGVKLDCRPSWPSHLRIKQGAKLGFFHTVLALSIVGAMTFQRVILDRYEGPDQVGVFYLYYGLVSFIPSVVESAVFGIFLPRLIELLYRGDFDITKFIVSYSIISFFVFGAIYFALYLWLSDILYFIDKPSLIYHRDLFVIMCCYSIVFFVVRGYHYLYYSLGKDTILLVIYSLSLIGSIIFGSVFVPMYGVYGAAFAMLVYASISFGMFIISHLSVHGKGLLVVNKDQ